MDKNLLQRTTFSTSRLLDFFSEKDLVAQIGHPVDEWLLVAGKELVDNALDACEESGTAPLITVTVDTRGITVADNGPGLPAEVVGRILDYSIRVSSRAAYVSPTRGAQGNALKTLVAMPFVLAGGQPVAPVTISARGIRHEIEITVDRIKQEPVIEHRQVEDATVRIGTSVTIPWPLSARSKLDAARGRFLSLVSRYRWFNPHLTLSFDWQDEHHFDCQADNPEWVKWRPSDHTSAHWYDHERFTALATAYVNADRQNGAQRTVRDFVREFRGLSSTVKAGEILNDLSLARLTLNQALVVEDSIDEELTGRLLAAMQAASTPVKPRQLGVIGQD